MSHQGVDKLIDKRNKTDVMRLTHEECENLSNILINVLNENEHIDNLIRVNLLKNAPSYDLTLFYDTKDEDNKKGNCQNRLILFRNVIEQLKKDEFKFDEEIGYLDIQYVLLNDGYYPYYERIIARIYIDDFWKIKFGFLTDIPDELKEKVRIFASKVFHLFISIFFAFLNPKEVERVVEYAPNHIVNRENKERSKNKNPIKCQRILVLNPKGFTKYVRTGGKEFKRITNVWGVIGHIRHYKNGKKVYVRPYEKGKDRNKGLLKERERKIVDVELKNIDLLKEENEMVYSSLR